MNSFYDLRILVLFCVSFALSPSTWAAPLCGSFQKPSLDGQCACYAPNTIQGTYTVKSPGGSAEGACKKAREKAFRICRTRGETPLSFHVVNKHAKTTTLFGNRVFFQCTIRYTCSYKPRRQTRTVNQILVRSAISGRMTLHMRHNESEASFRRNARSRARQQCKTLVKPDRIEKIDLSIHPGFLGSKIVRWKCFYTAIRPGKGTGYWCS